MGSLMPGVPLHSAVSRLRIAVDRCDNFQACSQQRLRLWGGGSPEWRVPCRRGSPPSAMCSSCWARRMQVTPAVTTLLVLQGKGRHVLLVVAAWCGPACCWLCWISPACRPLVAWCLLAQQPLHASCVGPQHAWQPEFARRGSSGCLLVPRPSPWLLQSSTADLGGRMVSA